MGKRPLIKVGRRTCICEGKLTGHRTHQAMCHDLSGVSTVDFQTAQCTRRTCRTRIGPNFYWSKHKKINFASMADIVKQGVLFISSKRCFSLSYLKLYANLHFRCYVSSAGVAWCSLAGADAPEDIPSHFREMHADALMYYLAIKEFEEIDRHKSIVVGDEISDVTLKKYDTHLHTQVYPPADRTSVTVLVGDGHMKVAGRCPGATGRYTGRPRKTTKNGMKVGKGKKNSGEKSPHNKKSNGWFMLCDPKSQRVLCVQQMVSPENNLLTTAAIEKVLSLYKAVDTFVLDRNCQYAPSASKLEGLSQIKYWPVEPWHGLKHTSKCRYCTKNVPSYKRRLKGVNCSICEQTFAWFRGYARTLNEMRHRRHVFLALHYTRRHNENIHMGRVDYLNKFSVAKKNLKSRSYECSKK